MIAVFIMVSILAGLAASTTALVMGSSILAAVGWYVAAGSFTLVAFPSVAAAIRVTRVRRRAEAQKGQGGATPVAPQMETAEGGAGAPTMRILAVDDDPFVLELVPKIAANAGFEDVTTVSSGAEALALLAKSDQTFDCLLLDIKMPEMDGIALCRKVRETADYHVTPIIMLTAMRDLTSMGDAFQAGASDYATKPFDVEELGKRLQLANASNLARQEQNRTLRENKGYKEMQTARSGYDLVQDAHLSGARTLVQEAVLSNYLTQLPNKLVDDVHVYALSIANLDVIQSNAQPHEFLTLLEDVASAAERCIGANLLLTAYSNYASLLMIVDSACQLSQDHLESEIKRQLVAVGGIYGTHEAVSMSLSVGGPILPKGPREQRARMTIDRAVSLSVSRLGEPETRTAVGFFNR